MKKFSTLYILIICFVLFINAFGQTPSSTPIPQTTPLLGDETDVVKISTSLIQVDATVLDKDGKVVSGLTADDFEIYENGKKQQITNLSFIGTPSADSTTVKPDKKAIPVPSTPSVLRPEQVRRTIALVVDDLDISFTSINSVKSALKKYVDEQMQPGDLVAIIRTGAGAGALQQFTSDKRLLYAAINRVRWNPSGSGKISPFASSDPSDTNADSNSTGGKIAMANYDRVDDLRDEIFSVGTLGAVNYIVKGMRELPGRKAVVLFSEGFNLYIQDRTDLENNIKRPSARLMANLQRLIDMANRSSVIIYGIDARGLVVPIPGADDNVTPSGGGGKFDMGIGKEAGTAYKEQVEALMESQQGLRYLSEQTGGFAVTNNNNLNKGIERALNDQNGYYLIAYQPDSESFNPKNIKFNSITVKLKRPDLRVRYRSGFYGIKDEERAAQASTPRQQILSALTSPLGSGNIDIQLTSLFANDNQTGNFMRSLVYINGKDLKFTEGADGWQNAKFTIVAMIFGENGAVDEVSRTQTIKARAETLQEILDKGFVSTLTFPIKKPGPYQMRIVIRDDTAAQIGSANQFIEVPNLGKDRLTLSGLLLERTQLGGEANKTAGPQTQFQPDEQRDMATRSFHAGMSVRFGYAVYNAKSDQTANAPNLSMQYKIFNNGKEVFTSKEIDAKLTDKKDMQHLLGEGIFTLGKNIQPGDYVLQMIIKDRSVKGKNQTATQWTDFEVAQ